MPAGICLGASPPDGAAADGFTAVAGGAAFLVGAEFLVGAGASTLVAAGLGAGASLPPNRYPREL